MQSPSPFARIIEHRPEWDDPWGQPRYYMGVTGRRIYAYLLDLVIVTLLLDHSGRHKWTHQREEPDLDDPMRG